jgi:uncharacterized protein
MKPPRAPHKQFDATGKRFPVRTCAVCRQRLPQSTLLRIARDASNLIQLDEKRRLSGRGQYICNNPACRTEKALMRISRADATRLSTELEAWFNHPQENPYEKLIRSEEGERQKAKGEREEHA